MATKELWEIEFDLKTQKFADAQKFYDQSLEKIKQGEKRLTAAIMAEEKRTTAAKLSEIRTREAVVKSTLAKELTENKTKNAKELIDYKQMYAEKNRIARESAAQLKAQQKSDSKFTGQSSELGSLNHIQGLRRTLKNTAPGTDQYAALNTRLKELSANYNLATGKNSLFNRGLLETGENLVTISAGLYFAATGLMRFAGSTVTAFAEQERSQLQLKAVTGDNIAQYERFIGLSSDMQNKWGIPDEVTQSLIAYSVAQERSEGQITKNIEAARILAIVQGIDIQSAYKQVEATLEGNTRSLGRNEKDFKGLTQEQLENGAAVDLIISKWGKLGDIQDSTSVKTAKLSAAWSESKETIGSVIVDALSPLGESLANIGLKGQDVVKWVASAVIGIDKFSGIIKITDKVSKDLISTFGNMAGQLPVVGGFYSSITSYAMQYRDMLYSIIGVQDAMSNGATFDNARGGNRGGINLKDPTANSGTLFKGGRTGTGSNNTPEKTLNFLEQFQKQIQDLETDITSLNSLMGTAGIKEYEKLQLQDQLIAKQKELNELKRIGLTLGSPMSLDGLLAQEVDLPGMIMRRGIKLPSSYANDPRPDMSSGEFQAMIQAQIDKERAILDYSSQAADKFLSILETSGMIDDEFMNIINTFKNAIGTGNEFFNILDGFLSVIPGGGIISSVIGSEGGGGGMGQLPNYTMPQNNTNNVTVVLRNPVTFRKAFEVTSAEQNTRVAITRG